MMKWVAGYLQWIKRAAELIFKSYYHSFKLPKTNIRIAVARAGNIGGGDWAKIE